MLVVAKWLNRVTGGRLSPNAVTIVGLLAHIPIAYLIATDSWPLAALLLLIFGLFDTLDGDLARLQKVDSPAGMLLDSTTDRMKEIILYIGIGYGLVSYAKSAQEAAITTAFIAAACGGSVLVSYVNAWGEVVMASAGLQKHKINQAFRGGILRFEVRMFLLIFGLVTGWLESVVIVIAILAWFTALERLYNITKRLRV